MMRSFTFPADSQHLREQQQALAAGGQLTLSLDHRVKGERWEGLTAGESASQVPGRCIYIGATC